MTYAMIQLSNSWDDLGGNRNVFEKELLLQLEKELENMVRPDMLLPWFEPNWLEPTTRV